MKKFLCFVMAAILSLGCALAVPVVVEAAYGTVSVWDGVIDLYSDAPFLYLKNTHVSQYSVDENAQSTISYIASYEGDAYYSLRIPTTQGMYYTGTVMKYITVSYTGEMSNGITQNYITPYSEPVQYDGYRASVDIISRSSDYSCVIALRVDFEGYRADDSGIVVPYNVSFHTTTTNSSAGYIVSHLGVKSEAIEDYVGTLIQYSDLRDVPTEDGDIATLLSEIRDKDATIIIQNETQITEQQTANNLQTQNNQLQSEQNAILGSTGNIDNNTIDSTVSNFNSTEDALIGTSMDDIQSFDFNASLPSNMSTGAINAFAWVSLNLSKLFYLTPFDGVFQVTCALLLACILVGLRRLWKG